VDVARGRRAWGSALRQHRESGRLYIGSSIDWQYRLRKHRERLKAGKHINRALQNAFDKHGEDAFEFSCLLVCASENLLMYEQNLMDFYKSYVKPFGYNIRKKAESNLGVPSNRMSFKEGDRYGRWVLLRQQKVGSNKWLCQCDCGCKKIVSASSLKNGDSSSCGCYQRERFSQVKTLHKAGDKYGRLTLISLVQKRGNIGHLWLMKCDCGKDKIANVKGVKQGYINSCGCLKSEKSRLSIKNTPTHMWAAAKRQWKQCWGDNERIYT